ncbi:mannosyltransferase [Kitasatospora sp. GAS204A]|uniref:glycosyltransferase family 39 protein n=1 Tax=unclassified Kitasatospora TaxID=2633591 RepID=UPI0024743BF9|nr:glycosyltransferase family 39 protein [Kitasatospora sp. GAS204B]MDH6120584.1 mannosyltransferase [Kitasatospora sp. GAS204B]
MSTSADVGTADSMTAEADGVATSGRRSWRRDERWRRLLARTSWLWPALLTLAFGLRGSSRPQMWRDELATWSAATRSTGELLAMLRHVDAVSGFYYLLMHFWAAAFGESPMAFRLPSALAMTAASVFVVLTGRKVFGTRAGLAAGLLFAVLPSVSKYAQEARSYAFVVLAVAAANWLLLRALERPTVRRWLPYSVSIALAGLFHVVSLAVLVPHAVVVLLRWRERGRSRLPLGFAAAVVLAVLPVIPLVLLGRRQVKRQISWLSMPDLQNFVDLWHNLFSSQLVSGCVLALCVLPAAWPRGRRRAVEIGLIASLPILLVWFVSQGSVSYFLDRYLLFTVPAWAVLAAGGLTALRPRPLIVLGLVGTALLGIQDQYALRTANVKEWADEKGAAQIVASGYRPGDGIVPVRGDKRFMMLDFAMDVYLPRSVRPTDVFQAETPARAHDLYPVDCAQPAVCARGFQRIWVLTYGGVKDPYQEIPKAQAAVLKAEFTAVRIDTAAHGLAVSLLERKPDAP